jgi:PEP-CTERM/exosortase A-associated glycosyltransferase
MKILHVLDHSIPLHSGYAFRTRAILDQQRALGWETAHVTSSKHKLAGPDIEDVDGLRFYRTPPGDGAWLRLPIVNQWGVVRSLESRLAQVVETERPDVLHAHSPSLNGLAALRVGQRWGLPVVYECRAFWEDAAADHGTAKEGGLRYRLTRMTETSVFRKSDAVTCICEGLRTDILARGIPEEKVTVIPNAVDAARFVFGRPRDERLADELGLVGATVLGFLGSFYAYEGLELAVRAMPAIVARHPDARLLLVGGGPQEKALRSLVRSLDVGNQVIFVGRVPHDEVERYYSLVDVTLYPRLPMRLTELVTPLKPLEAMAQGKLVLASDVGGHRELIRQGESGVLFEAGNADALVEAASSLLDNRDGWEDLRRCARRYVEKERNWRGSISRYRLVYRAVSELYRGKAANLGN